MGRAFATNLGAARASSALFVKCPPGERSSRNSCQTTARPLIWHKSTPRIGHLTHASNAGPPRCADVRSWGVHLPQIVGAGPAIGRPCHSVTRREPDGTGSRAADAIHARTIVVIGRRDCRLFVQRGVGSRHGVRRARRERMAGSAAQSLGCLSRRAVLASHSSGKKTSSTIWRRYAAPAVPPVPRLMPITRSTTLRWRYRHSE